VCVPKLDDVKKSSQEEIKLYIILCKKEGLIWPTYHGSSGVW
jgi:hypothetical protein